MIYPALAANIYPNIRSYAYAKRIISFVRFRIGALLPVIQNNMRRFPIATILAYDKRLYF